MFLVKNRHALVRREVFGWMAALALTSSALVWSSHLDSAIQLPMEEGSY
jgi:hypothetical protein